MSWDQIREARDRGFTIGSHSFSHRHLTALSPDETVERERESRAILAKELGIDACVVAYPYGDIDAAQRQTMAVAGYDVAVTTEHGFASRFDHPMALPRLDVTGTTTIDEFAALVGAASS